MMPAYINTQTLKIIGSRIKAFGNEMETLDPVANEDYIDDMKALCDSVDELVREARKELERG